MKTLNAAGYVAWNFITQRVETLVERIAAK